MTDDVEQRVTGNATGTPSRPSAEPVLARRVTASARLDAATSEPGRQSAGSAVVDILWVLLPSAAWLLVGEALVELALGGGAAQPISYTVLLLNMTIRLVLVWRLIAWRLRVRKQQPALIGWTARKLVVESLLGLPTVVVLLMVSVAMAVWLLLLWPELLPVVYKNRRIGVMEKFPEMDVWQWVVLPIVVAAIEEPFFRGLLQQRLTVIFGHPIWGILAQAALFAGPHWYEGPTAALAIFYLGVILGALTWWRRSLVPAMVAHALFNIVNFGLIHFVRGYPI